ncbi:transposase [Streptomyces sp. H27-H1]|nr:transposase [Streptomyces sp. H27-H1]
MCDALLWTDGPVRTLVDLALAPEHRRGHGALYSGINQGRIDVARFRRALAAAPLPRASDGRLVLAVDVSSWLRPGAATSSDRSFRHTFGRGLGKHQMVPGWHYSIVAALESGRTSWTALLDAIRLEPGANVAAVTADQTRDVVERLMHADQWRESDPDLLVVLDAGYDAPRIVHLLADLPVAVLGRLRSDRVIRKPVPVPWICPPQDGRPPKYGGESVASTWSTPSGSSSRRSAGPGRSCGTRRQPTAGPGSSWPRMLSSAWLPSRTGSATAVGEAGGTEQTHPCPGPSRFRNRAKTGTPAGAPKPARPGPGRSLGSKNRRPATRYDVGRVLATGEAYSRPAHHKKGTKPRRTD